MLSSRISVPGKSEPIAICDIRSRGVPAPRVSMLMTRGADVVVVMVCATATPGSVAAITMPMAMAA